MLTGVGVVVVVAVVDGRVVAGVVSTVVVVDTAVVVESVVVVGSAVVVGSIVVVGSLVTVGSAVVVDSVVVLTSVVVSIAVGAVPAVGSIAGCLVVTGVVSTLGVDSAMVGLEVAIIAAAEVGASVLSEDASVGVAGAVCRGLFVALGKIAAASVLAIGCSVGTISGGSVELTIITEGALV